MGKWLVKTEPTTYSISDLARDKTTRWDGVRNALALIHLKAMKKGESVLIYHSGKDKAVVGMAKVAREAYPDPTDKEGKAVCVDLTFVSQLATSLPLARIKSDPSLHDLALIRISRLSVMPVAEAHWRTLLAMAE